MRRYTSYSWDWWKYIINLKLRRDTLGDFRRIKKKILKYHTLQCVSWISSCWKIYAVTKQTKSVTRGKDTVAKHNFLNDIAMCMELLLFPTLFSSIVKLSNILALIYKIKSKFEKMQDPNQSTLGSCLFQFSLKMSKNSFKNFIICL